MSLLCNSINQITMTCSCSELTLFGHRLWMTFFWSFVFVSRILICSIEKILSQGKPTLVASSQSNMSTSEQKKKSPILTL